AAPGVRGDRHPGARPAARLARGPLPAAHRGRCHGRGGRAAARARGGGVVTGTLTVYRWELRKLVWQKRTYLGLGAAFVVPLIFVSALALQSGQPNDVPFGRYVRDSGLAIPLVLLVFGSIWMFPLITALVAGDIVASEDHNGTLKTILTRSPDPRPGYARQGLPAPPHPPAALPPPALSGRTPRHPPPGCRSP